jgi:hypothetical protein
MITNVIPMTAPDSRNPTSPKQGQIKFRESQFISTARARGEPGVLQGLGRAPNRLAEA